MAQFIRNAVNSTEAQSKNFVFFKETAVLPRMVESVRERKTEQLFSCQFHSKPFTAFRSTTRQNVTT